MKFSTNLFALLVTLMLSSSFAMGEDTVNGYIKLNNATNWKTSAGDCWRNNLNDSMIRDTNCGYPAPAPAPKVVAAPPPPKAAPQAITIESSVLFEFDSAVLTDEGKAVISEEIKRHEGKKAATDRALSITGHTDSIGTREYNQQLSEQRAASIAQYIKQNTSLADHEITISGKGEDEPIASNDTSEGRSKNRRVELFFTGKVE